jgi:hypothetical protein
MATRPAGNGLTGFILAVVVALAAITAWVVWSDRTELPRPVAMELRLPKAPDLPAPTPMPNPQPAPVPIPTPG